MTAVELEPAPLRTGALSQRLRPLGQTVLMPCVLGALLCPDMGARQMYGKLTLQRSTRQPTQKLTRQFHTRACRESSLERKHGRLACCRYTTGASADGLAQRNCSCNLKFLVTRSMGKNQNLSAVKFPAALLE